MVTMLLVQWLGGGGGTARDVNIVVRATVREVVIVIVNVTIVINIKCIECKSEILIITVGFQLPGLQFL